MIVNIITFCCDLRTSINCDVKVFIRTDTGTCSLPDRVTKAQDLGAIGLVFYLYSSDAGLGSYAFKRNIDSYMRVSGVEMKMEDDVLKVLEAQNEPVMVWFQAGTLSRLLSTPNSVIDPNEYERAWKSGVITAFSIMFGLYGFFCAVFASYKLYGFVRAEGWRMRPAHICLSLIILAGLGLVSRSNIY